MPVLARFLFSKLFWGASLALTLLALGITAGIAVDLNQAVGNAALQWQGFTRLILSPLSWLPIPGWVISDVEKDVLVLLMIITVPLLFVKGTIWIGLPFTLLTIGIVGFREVSPDYQIDRTDIRLVSAMFLGFGLVALKTEGSKIRGLIDYYGNGVAAFLILLSLSLTGFVAFDV